MRLYTVTRKKKQRVKEQKQSLLLKLLPRTELMLDQIATRHDKYLGLLVVGGRSRRMLFKNIRDRLQERIEGWNTKMLS